MKTNNFRELVDRDLSGLVWDERQSQSVRRVLDEEERPVKKKLSTAMVIVIALLVLGMAAALASGFGILNFRENQAENDAFVQSIFTVGQTYEDDNLTLRLNDAVFDGTRLAFTMDILPRADGQQVFVYPHITATANGKQIATFVEQCVGQFPDGFWAPNVKGMEDESPQQQYVSVALMSDADGSEVSYAAQDAPIDWTLTFDIYRPNWPITVTQEQRPSYLAGEPVYTDEAIAMDTAYDAMFAEAYRKQQILAFGGCPGDALSDYGRNLPKAEGTAYSLTSGTNDVESALHSDAFTQYGQADFAFTTRAISQTSPQAGQTFPLTEEWQAELVSLNATIDHIDCTMKLTRSAADGKTALQAYQEGENPWNFAILPEGGEAAEPITNGYGSEDGSMIWMGSVEIMTPVDRVTIVPCRSSEAVAWVEAATDAAPLSPLNADETTESVYRANGPVTENQKRLAFTLEVEK